MQHATCPLAPSVLNPTNAPAPRPGPALPDAAYADEGPEGSPAPPVVQSRGVLCRLLAAPLRTACVDLRVRAPQSDVDRKATALLSTFRYVLGSGAAFG